jgi:hypothetical protein
MSPSDSESSSSGLRITDGLAALPWLNTDDDSDFSGGSVFGDWLPSPNQEAVFSPLRQIFIPQEKSFLFTTFHYYAASAQAEHTCGTPSNSSYHSATTATDQSDTTHGTRLLRVPCLRIFGDTSIQRAMLSSRSQNRSRPRPFGKEHNPTIS